MADGIKNNLKQRATWLRGLYMLMYAIFYSIAEILITAVVIFQFLLFLFTGRGNERLLKFGQSLATYVYQVLQYLTFNSEYQAYPFGAWPKGPPREKDKISNVLNDEAEPSTDERENN